MRALRLAPITETPPLLPPAPPAPASTRRKTRPAAR